MKKKINDNMKLSEGKKQKILKLLTEKRPIRYIAKKVHVSPGTVQKRKQKNFIHTEKPSDDPVDTTPPSWKIERDFLLKDIDELKQRVKRVCEERDELERNLGEERRKNEAEHQENISLKQENDEFQYKITMNKQQTEQMVKEHEIANQNLRGLLMNADESLASKEKRISWLTTEVRRLKERKTTPWMDYVFYLLAGGAIAIQCGIVAMDWFTRSKQNQGAPQTISHPSGARPGQGKQRAVPRFGRGAGLGICYPAVLRKYIQIGMKTSHVST